MEKNHRKNQRFGESSGVSEKFDAYITKTIRHKFQDLYFKDRTEARRYLAMALDAMDRFPSKPHRHLLELNKVCIGKTAIYLEGDDLANDFERMPEHLKRVLELLFVYGYEEKEVACELDISIKSVFQYKWEALR